MSSLEHQPQSIEADPEDELLLETMLLQCINEATTLREALLAGNPLQASLLSRVRRHRTPPNVFVSNIDRGHRFLGTKPFNLYASSGESADYCIQAGIWVPKRGTHNELFVYEGPLDQLLNRDRDMFDPSGHLTLLAYISFEKPAIDYNGRVANNYVGRPAKRTAGGIESNMDVDAAAELNVMLQDGVNTLIYT